MYNRLNSLISRIKPKISSFYEKNKTHIFVFIYVSIITHTIWLQLETLNFGFEKKYYTFAPDRYRMQIQLLLFLNRKIFNLSFFTLSAIAFLVCIYIVYLLIKPQNENLLYFFLILTLFLVRFDVDSSLMYVLILLIVKYKKAFILLFLILIKEIAFYLSFFYLLFHTDVNKKELYLYGGISGIIYAFIRFILIGNRPDYLNIFIFPVIENFREVLRQIPQIIIVSFFIYILFDKKYTKLLLIYLIPLVVFALPYEIQQWVPFFLIIIYEREHGTKEEHEYTSEVTNVVPL